MVMRVGGLASGMDIDALVEKLMSAERVPLNKLQQKKQTYEWQRDAYRGVNTKLKTFDTYIGDNLVLKSITSKTATSSNSNLVSATASGTASGTISIEGVSQLATAARAVGDQINATGSTKLSDLGITDTSIELKSIQNDGSMGTATKIEFDSNTTIDQLLSKINSSNAGVSAIFENGRLSISAKNTGDNKNGAEIEVVSGDDVFNKLGITSLADGKLADGGQNAKFTINGIDTERTSNTFSISGYSVTLKDTFDNTQAVTVTSTTNLDDMMTKIKDFVTTYNGLIKDLSDKTKESKYRDYAPLTDEQKKEMDEDEIKLWEEKAKSGLLRSDSLIRNGLSNMRSLVYQSNPGIEDTRYNTLYSIGITTSKNYNDGGTLEIDENKLRKALEENPDAVEQLLKNTDGVKNDPAHGGADTRGYLEKLRESMKTLETNIDKKAGRSTMTDAQYSIGKSLMDNEKRINTWQDKLKNIEARYWKQFTAMETAISKANQQSSMFMQE